MLGYHYNSRGLLFIPKAWLWVLIGQEQLRKLGKKTIIVLIKDNLGTNLSLFAEPDMLFDRTLLPFLMGSSPWWRHSVNWSGNFGWPIQTGISTPRVLLTEPNFGVNTCPQFRGKSDFIPKLFLCHLDELPMYTLVGAEDSLLGSSSSILASPTVCKLHGCATLCWYPTFQNFTGALLLTTGTWTQFFYLDINSREVSVRMAQHSAMFLPFSFLWVLSALLDRPWVSVPCMTPSG